MPPPASRKAKAITRQKVPSDLWSTVVSHPPGVGATGSAVVVVSVLDIV